MSTTCEIQGGANTVGICKHFSKTLDRNSNVRLGR